MISFHSQVSTLEDFDSDSDIGEFIQFNVIVSWITCLSLYKNDTLVQTIKIRKQKMKSTFILSDNIKTNKASFYKFTIVAMQDDKQMVKTHRFVRTVLSRTHYLTLSSNSSLLHTFGDGSTVYNQTGLLELGWNIIDNTLQLANVNGKYAPLLRSTYSLFIILPQNGTFGVYMKGLLDTEFNCDILTLSVKPTKQVENKQTNRDLLFRLSGDDQVFEQLLDLGDYKGLSIEVSIGFSSDPLVEGRGVTIETLAFFTDSEYENKVSELESKMNDPNMLGDELSDNDED